MYDEIRSLKRKFIISFALLFFTFAAGVVGYMHIEHWNIQDSLFMTVITLATVGYGETNPLSPDGRIFTMLLILVGMSTFVYGVTTITAFLVEGELGGYLRRKKMLAKIQDFKEHYIVCGAGDIGSHIVEEFSKTGRDFVLIDASLESVKKMNKERLFYVIGDAHDDAILKQAGIDKAKGVICALPSDQDNLFAVISARTLNPDVRIVTRCQNDNASQKLTRAGANAVVSTNRIGGLRMASEMVRPMVVSFLDKMLRGPQEGLRVEEVRMEQFPSAISKTLKELDVPNTTGMIVLAVSNTQTGEYVFNPKEYYQVRKEDSLIVIGAADQLAKFKASYA